MAEALRADRMYRSNVAIVAIVAVFTVSVALVVTGCRGAPPTGFEGARRQMESSGRRLEGFAPAEAARLSALRCEGGRIDGIDAMLCEYPDEAAARAARPRGEAWIGGAVTGVTLEQGKL